MNFSDIIPIGDLDIEKESFKIDSYEKAEWALEKAGSAQAAIDDMERQAEDMIDKIRAALDERTKGLRETVERMAWFLDPWTRQETDKLGKKSIPLAGGVLKIVTGRESLVIEDDAVLLEYLKANNGDFLRVKTTEAPDKDEIKKAIKNDGLEFPGCRVEKGKDRLEMKPREIEVSFK